VHVLTVRSVASGVLPPSAARWHSLFPTTVLRLHDFSHRRDLEEAARSGQGDLAVGPRPSAWGSGSGTPYVSRVADSASGVMRHADAGDPVARRIVRDAAEQIDELVRRLAECGAARIALLGGLASSMQPWLAPDVQRRLVPVEGDAVDGALHLARGAVMKG